MEQLSTSTRMACCGVRLHLDMPLVFCLVSTEIYIWHILTLLFGECRDIHLDMPLAFCLVSTEIYIGYVLSHLFGEYRNIHLICPQSSVLWYRDIHVDISPVFCLVSTDMPSVLFGEYRHLFGFTVYRFYNILLTGLYRLNINEGFSVSGWLRGFFPQNFTELNWLIVRWA